ncbi:MAG: 5-(carboxyamino)imidazole ribonucleotide synthase [Maricaulaceae bacterium]
MAAQDMLPPNSIIGIFGGGQLGRMLSLAAARLGFKTHIYCPEENGPASHAAFAQTNAAYDDLDAVRAFAKTCDVLTYEFENIPYETAKAASEHCSLYPGTLALQTAQDRLVEKSFIRDKAGVAVADFADITNLADLQNGIEQLCLPAVLKTRRFGYDGKGQAIIRTPSDIEPALESMKGAPCILERFIPFIREVSIVAARSTSGEMAAYPVIENVHKDHILHTSTAPAPKSHADAPKMAFKVMEALGYYGVMATEFFELDDGSLIVNEIAPRVHNSGHWTQDAGCVDQFELHIRAIAGWPLGDVTPKYKMQMTNLIGDDVDETAKLSAEPSTFLHLYGKAEARPKRKMGHINRILGPL